MKKLLSGLSVVLMILGFSGSLSSLLAILRLPFSAEASFGLFLSLLILLALFAGLGILGGRLWRKNHAGLKKKDKAGRTAPETKQASTAAAADRSASEPQGSPQEPAAAPQETPGKSEGPEKPAQAGERRKSLGQRVPSSMEHVLCLYEDLSAEKTAFHLLREVCESIELGTREGEAILRVGICEGVEYGVGKMGIERHDEEHSIPRELCASLTPGTLRPWAERTIGKRCQILWEEYELSKSLISWCGRVRRFAGAGLPDCLYPEDPPFPALEEIGPDGLSDESGVAVWARLKAGKSFRELMAVLPTLPQDRTIFVLTGQAPYDTPKLRDRLLLDRSGVRYGFSLSEKRVRNLVDDRAYRLAYQQWPGSADDAATEGRWWLEEEAASAETRLFDITEQILSDCRALGATDQQIRSLLTDGLSREAGEGRSQLHFDAARDEYQVLYRERGSTLCTVAEKDPEEFRFSFLREYYYRITSISKNMRDPEAAANMLQLTKERFGHTESYRRTLQSYEQTFGPLPVTAWRDDFGRYICPALVELGGDDHFFGEITGRFTDLRPLDHFTKAWAEDYPNGRFVILVCERHSVYFMNHRIYENPAFTGTPDALWRKTLPAYRLYAESISVNPDLWIRTKTEYLGLREAEETAARLSFLLKTRVCVARTVTDYDRW